MYMSFWDKWLLPIAAVVIGLVILWGLFIAPGRAPEEAKGIAAKK